MIVPIVRMTFDRDRVPEFLEIFESARSKIRNYPGCEYLSLHRDANHANVYYTLSHWQSANHLETYRKSDLFETTWTKTKLLFCEKPTAHSLVLQDEVGS